MRLSFAVQRFLTVCSIREYRSNVTDTCYVWIADYRSINRKLRRILGHIKLDRHVEHTCYRQAPAIYRQAK